MLQMKQKRADCPFQSLASTDESDIGERISSITWPVLLLQLTLHLQQSLYSFSGPDEDETPDSSIGLRLKVRSASFSSSMHPITSLESVNLGSEFMKIINKTRC